MNNIEQRIKSCEHLPKVLANKIAFQYELKCDMEDLIAYGTEGLVQAANNYKTQQGAVFSTYAYYRVRGAILDGVREMGYTSPKIQARHRLAQLTLAKHFDDISEQALEPSVSDLSTPHTQETTLEMDLQKAEDTLHKMTASFMLQCLYPRDSDADNPETVALGKEKRAWIQNAVDVLPEREKKIIVELYFKERTAKQVAKEMKCSEGWFTRLHMRALELLKANLKPPARERTLPPLP